MKKFISILLISCALISTFTFTDYAKGNGYTVNSNMPGNGNELK